MDISAVFLTLWCLIMGNVTGQFYKYNCLGSFHPEDSVIENPKLNEFYSCYWHLEATPGDKFLLEFYHSNSCMEEIPHLQVWDINDKHLKYISTNSCNIVTTRGNEVQMTYSNHKKSWHGRYKRLRFHVAMAIETSRLVYRLYNMSLSWREAEEHCQIDGGTLAVMYPVRTAALNDLTSEIESELWLGQSVSPWVWLRGCVFWANNENIRPVYSKSKYNQFTECSWACLGSAYFLLQDTSCYCIREAVSEKRELYSSCNISCPGDRTETCGGMDTFTKYQYYKEEKYKGTMNEDCMTTGRDTFPEQTPSDCKLQHGFTCEFLNGSSQTYKKKHSWSEARDFCGKLKNSLGLQAVPSITGDVLSQWTSVIRKVDWNYPTVTRRLPTYSFSNSDGISHVLPSSEQHPFVCQYDNVTCGSNLTSNHGNLISPSYPDNYNINKHCVWQIQVSDESVMEIVWQNLSLEDSDQCIYDYIEFQEYPTVRKQRFCGTDLPESFISKTSIVKVVFHSDSTFIGQGFNFTWRAVEAPPESEESVSRKAGLSGGIIVGITISMTVVVAMVIIGVVLFKRRQPRQKNRYDVPKSSAGISNAVYGASSIDDSEFSSVSKAYQNESQIRRQRNLGKVDSDADYENVQKPLHKTDEKPANAEGATSEITVTSLAELDKLGMENINVESTVSTEDIMEAHEYEKVPKKIKQNKNKKEKPSNTKEKNNSKDNTSNLSAGAKVCVEPRTSNVYHEIDELDLNDGYLEPKKGEAHVYQDLI